MIILIHFMRDLRDLPSAKTGRETLAMSLNSLLSGQGLEVFTSLLKKPMNMTP
jgi:hypothetical protein